MKYKKNQYGLGSWLGENSGNLIKTGAGAALLATGVGAPLGAGLLASGGAGLVADNLVEDPNSKAALNTAGQVGGMVAGATMGTPIGYANGGPLVEFNNGGTHEQNPQGGIPLGETASVEQGETKWQDYIFSDRIPTGNKKETFADASKKIQKKYTRENDTPSQKALEREMNALMTRQEVFRNKLGVAPSNQFGNGGDTKSNKNTELAITPGNTTVRQDALVSRRDKITDPNYAYLKEIEPTYTKPNLHAEGINPALKDFESEVSKKNEDIMEFRRRLYSRFKDVPLDKTVNVKSVDPKTGERYFSDEDISNYEKNLEWKNEVYRNYYGYTPKDYRGAKEKEAGKSNNPDELLYGPRMRTGITDDNMIEGWEDNFINELKEFVKTQNPEDRKLINSPKLPKAYGGKIQMRNGGLDPNSFNTLNQILNPNLGALNPEGLSAQTTNTYTGNVDNSPAKFQTIKEIEAEIDQAKALESQNNTIAQKSFEQPTSEVKATADGLTNAPDNTGVYQNAKLDKFDYLTMGAQALPGFYNLGKGLKGSKPIQYDRLAPNLVDYSSSARVTNDAYDQQANITNEAIRSNATSAGQALTNKIAHSNIAAKQKADALSQINEKQFNTNQQIRGSVDQSNLQVSINEEIANAQQDAANQQAIATGLGQLGNAAGMINRDRNIMKTNEADIQMLGDGRKYRLVYNPTTKRNEMQFIA